VCLRRHCEWERIAGLNLVGPAKPWAKENLVDHTLTDQSSIIAFIGNNWRLCRFADGYADVFAGSVENMFDFTEKKRKYGNIKCF
jgi:hypothetical protein